MSDEKRSVTDHQPMRKNRCDNCIFWNASLNDFVDPGHPDNEAECSRFPPVLNVVALQECVKENESEEFHDGDIPYEKAAQMSQWCNPVTTAEHSCGEWKPIDEDEASFRNEYRKYFEKSI